MHIRRDVSDEVTGLLKDLPHRGRIVSEDSSPLPHPGRAVKITTTQNRNVSQGPFMRLTPGPCAQHLSDYNQILICLEEKDE